MRSIEDQFRIKIPLPKITPEYFDSVDEIEELILKVIEEGKDG